VAGMSASAAAELYDDAYDDSDDTVPAASGDDAAFIAPASGTADGAAVRAGHVVPVRSDGRFPGAVLAGPSSPAAVVAGQAVRARPTDRSPAAVLPEAPVSPAGAGIAAARGGGGPAPRIDRLSGVVGRAGVASPSSDLSGFFGNTDASAAAGGSAGAAGLRMVRAAGLSGVVRPASAHAAGEAGPARTLPVLSALRGLLPGGGLRRGTTIAVRSSSVLLALLVAASRAGSWCAVVGLPALSPIAAAEMGIALERLALVPYPGVEWTSTVAALLDGLDIVVAAPPGAIAPAVAGRLAARARQRGSVLMPAGDWVGADLTVAPVRGQWDGLGAGRGRLRCRELTIQARGRGAAAAPREVTLWLPALEGVLPPVAGHLPGSAAPGAGSLRRVG